MIRPILLLSAAAFACSCSSVKTPKGKNRGYESARLVQTSSASVVQGVEDSPEVNSWIQDAIATKFSRNGIPVGSPEADLIIAYMLIRQTTASTTMNADYFGRGRDAEEILAEAHKRGVIENKSPDEFAAGAIVIDVLDARSNKLKFRNFAKRELVEGLPDEVRKQRIQAAVKEALAPFFR